MAVNRRSNARALARNGMLSSYAASSVRRTTPRTDWCQPAAWLTRPARPPRPPRPRCCPPPPAAPRAPRGAAAAPRALAAAALSWRWTPPPGPRGPPPPARPAHWPFRRRASSSPRIYGTLCAACSCRPRARTGTRPPPRPPARRGRPRTTRRLRARSFARLEVVRRVSRYRARRRVGLQRRFHKPIHRRARTGDAQLLEQERERLLQVGPDRPAHVFGKIPHAPLERPHCFLAALVDELLLVVALLPLVLALGRVPRIDLRAQVGRQPGVVEDDGLEIRGEVDLDRLARREVPERLRRQRGGAVLHRAAETVLRPRLLRERPQRVEVDLHLGDGAVRQDHAAVAGAGLHGDLADPHVRAEPLEGAQVAVHERPQLVDVAVLATHFPDLGPDGDGDARGLAVADELGQFGGTLDVDALLRVDRRLRQVDQRGRVHVDVVEPGRQLFLDQAAHRGDLGLRIDGVLLRVHLDVVALDEERAGEAFAQCGGGHHRHIFDGPLLGVPDLAAGDLADQGAHVEPLGRPEDRAGRIVGQDADIHRRRGERGELAPAAREVQVVDRCRPHPCLLAGLPDHPPRLFALSRAPEDRPPHQLVHRGALAHRRLLEPAQRLPHLLRHTRPPQRGN